MKKILVIFLFLNSIFAFSQEPYYSDPVRIPILISGSFAELRSNHFHSGIDIKTQGRVGFPVHAVADGFISRIVVSPTGYGRALYISHPNGTTSVYGHLQSFRDDIEAYVKELQYNRRSFKTDVQLVPGRFPLKKGDIVATTGNSGSSGGPHLHFELRDTKSEEPINPLNYNFHITDKIPPKIFSLMVVPLSDTSHVTYGTKQRSYSAVLYDGSYHLKNNPVIPVSGEIGFAVQTYDYLDGTWNKCGINSMQLTIDDEIYFSYQNDRFSFDESRYINSFIVYDEYIRSRSRFMKTWIDPGNKLSVYNYTKGNGTFHPSGNRLYNVRIEIKDSYGNTSTLKFSVEHSPKKMVVQQDSLIERFSYDQENRYNTDEFELVIPGGALYKDLDFTYKTMPLQPGFYSDIHVVHKNSVPLHKNCGIKIKVKDLPAELEKKALLVNIDDMSGDYWSAGGTYKDGWIKSGISTFGHYAVKIDTLSPTVLPLSITGKTTLTEADRIRFRIEDDLSGIKTIEGTLDGKWALFEYDPKNKRITHYFDKERFEFGKQHSLKLIVSDYKQNETVYEATFYK